MSNALPKRAMLVVNAVSRHGEAAFEEARETYLIGSPEEIIEVVKMYDALGVDQLIYSPLTMTMDQKYVLRSIETFGKHVLPQFDRDPVHRTKRLREAAVARAA